MWLDFQLHLGPRRRYRDNQLGTVPQFPGIYSNEALGRYR